MNNGEVEALMAMKEIARQLRIANRLKAWELKEDHRELTPPHTNSAEIDEIMEG